MTNQIKTTGLPEQSTTILKTTTTTNKQGRQKQQLMEKPFFNLPHQNSTKVSAKKQHSHKILFFGEERFPPKSGDFYFKTIKSKMSINPREPLTSVKLISGALYLIATNWTTTGMRNKNKTEHGLIKGTSLCFFLTWCGCAGKSECCEVLRGYEAVCDRKIPSGTN